MRKQRVLRTSALSVSAARRGSARGVLLAVLALGAATVHAQSTPGAAQASAAPDTAPQEALNLGAPVSVPTGILLASCLDTALDEYFVRHLQRFGQPEQVRDTAIRYRKDRNTIHLAMFGSAETSDDAKKRLESRKTALDFAVKRCSDDFGLSFRGVYMTIEFTYSNLDREKGKEKPLLRWHRGRWELL